MKTIVMAAAASPMLMPAAFAAIPVTVQTAAKPVASSEKPKDAAMQLANGANRSGTVSSTRGGRGFIPGKGWAG
ncbi:hypothetical protein PV773_02840 [Mesorhizobium sp. CC13]|uniref:hypothetical protein n=1 Tax=Mesorhizobium sp. CC13 TaxID=3029194 RepID=UPI0032679377